MNWNRITLIAATSVSAACANPTTPSMTLESRPPLTSFVRYVEVPENRSDPRSRRIRVAYVHLASAAPGLPTFVTFGGPGESVLDFKTIGALRKAFAHLLEIGDVVFIEQRGVGASRPRLDCDPIRLPTDQPATVAGLIAGHAATLPSCIAEAHADLRGYTTVEIADDMEAVRRGLGFDKINLSGGSYGAQQGYFYLRRHSARVERAYLSQFLAPGGSLALPRIVDQYVRELGERATVRLTGRPGGGDDLVRLISDVLKRNEVRPTMVRGDFGRLTLGRTDIEIVTSLALRRTRESWMLPSIYRGFAEGQYALAADVAQSFFRGGLPVNAAVLAMDCAAQVLPERQREFEATVDDSVLGRGAHMPFPDVCKFIDHGDVGPDFSEAGPIGDAHVLFVQGELDARARDEAMKQVLSRAKNASLRVIIDATHDLGISVDPAMAEKLRRAEQAFLNEGTVPDPSELQLQW